jgi:hypothetical protein
MGKGDFVSDLRLLSSSSVIAVAELIKGPARLKAASGG